MRSRRVSAAREQAVARRLADLSDDLARGRGERRGDHLMEGQAVGERPVLGRAVGAEWWSEHTRVVGEPGLSLVPPLDEPAVVPVDVPVDVPAVPVVGAAPQAGVLPIPGRHAARRPVRVPWAGLAERLPGSFTSGHVAVVAVLIAVALAFTTWQVTRADAEPPRPAAAAGVEAPAGEPLPGPGGEVGAAPAVEPTAPGGAPSAGTASVTVDVAGKVRRPGLVVLPSGSRVADALKKAGGARPGVSLTSLNLARVLVDGEQILVGVPGAAAPSGTTTAPPVPGAPTTLVNINTADQPTLETLPGVGPVTATAIITWREEHGGFSSINELLEVNGIGEVTLANLTPYITI